jgi:peptidoglycan/LPS O-acetylase OafA/YrhL
VPSKPAGNNFDLIRFAFASLVIFSHAYPLATGTEVDEPLMRLSRGQMTLGTLAVDCFFIISGFLISQSWTHKPRVRSYLAKRVRRIYPGFLVASALCAFVLAPLFAGNAAGPVITPAFAMDFVLHALRLLFLQPAPAFPDNPAAGPINGSLWSIPFEFWCYIGLMAVGMIGLLKRPGWLAWALAGLIAISFVVDWYDLKIGGKFLGVVFGYPVFWARLLPYFVVGMLFHGLADRVRFTSRGAIVAAVVLLIGCRVPYALILVLPLGAAYLILWLAFIPTKHLKNFARRGDCSYGIYLYAFPIEQLIVHATGIHEPWLLFALAWPASVLAGFLSWHLVESRFVKSSLGHWALVGAAEPTGQR